MISHAWFIRSIHVFIIGSYFFLYHQWFQIVVGILGVLVYVIGFRYVLVPSVGALEKWRYEWLQLLFLVLFWISTWQGAFLCWSGMLVVEYFRFRDIQEARNRKEALQLLMDEQQHQNEVFQKVRAERHDFLKHVSIIQYLVESKNTKELSSYIHTLVDEYTHTNRSIQGEAGHVAALLYRYKEQAEASRITITYNLQVPLSFLPMDMLDQSKLIGNLLANCLEAAEEYTVTKQQAIIQLQTSVHGGIFILEAKNHTKALSEETLSHLYKKFRISSKGNEHEGLGTYVIASLVQSYKGVLSYTYDAPIFSLKIKIPIVQNE